MKQHSPTKYDLVIFDCDGVLVHSEHISCRIYAEMLTEIGLPMSTEESILLFAGKSRKMNITYIEQQLGRAMPNNFIRLYDEKVFATFEEELEPVPGIYEALEKIKLPVCVASSGELAKIQKTLGLTGLYERLKDHILTGEDVKRGKPFPDLFLLSAKQMGVKPNCCAVVEDSLPGVQAGIAAGMTVFGYAKYTDSNVLKKAGAIVFSDMQDLPPLLGY